LLFHQAISLKRDKELMVDERAIPPAGRIGETEDLIGSVFVKDGKVGFRAGMHTKSEA
jgi:hypothetical protein